MVAVFLFEQDERQEFIESALKNYGEEIVKAVKTPIELLSVTAKLSPDLLIVDVAFPAPEILKTIDEIIRLKPVAVVLVSGEVDIETINVVANTGISARVINCTKPERMRNIIEVAQARFKKNQSLELELKNTKERLADRRDIEKAKGILMQQKELTENEAYHRLRKLAMDQNISLGEAARSLIGASELLT